MSRTKLPICAIPQDDKLEWLARELYALGYVREYEKDVQEGLDLLEVSRGGYKYIYVEGGQIWFGGDGAIREDDLNILVNSPLHMIQYLKQFAPKTL